MNKQLFFPIEKVWHVPVMLILGIYLPASLFGAYVFRDIYSISFLMLLAVFVAVYYGLYRRCVALVQNPAFLRICWAIGDRIPWKTLAWLTVVVYLVTLLVAVWTVPVTPLVAALHGGDWLEVSVARGVLFANRQGGEAILRYSALILGKSVLPFLVTYLFLKEYRFRYWALAGLLICYSLSLEKAAPIFAFAPLILMAITRGKARMAFAYGVACVICIAVLTFLSSGGLHRDTPSSVSAASQTTLQAEAVDKPEIGFSIGRHGDPQRHYFFNFVNALGVPFDFSTTGTDLVGKLMIMTNRSVWIPYVTAYDWLKFQDEIMGGGLTMGRQIGFVSWVIGEPRLLLEQMVYEYEFGVPPGGAGASNTVFLVDTKLAFGWPGVLINCIVFVLCASIVFSSNNDTAKLASVTSFFSAALSPLTATLLSGGLFFYLLVCLLVRQGTPEQGDELCRVSQR